MTAIDFLLTLLIFVLGSLISAVVLAFLGFFTIKRMISRGMESEEVKQFKEALDSLVKELERLKDRFDRFFNNKGANPS